MLSSKVFDLGHRSAKHLVQFTYSRQRVDMGNKGCAQCVHKGVRAGSIVQLTNKVVVKMVRVGMFSWLGRINRIFT